MPSHDHPSHDVNLKKVDRLSATRVRLTLEFPAETIAEHEKMTANHYARSAKIPGFRPGKAPLTMVRERYKDEILQHVLSHLLEAGISEGIQKAKLTPVSRPKVTLGEFAPEKKLPLSFEAEFDVQPEIEVRKYKGVPLKNQSLDASEDEVKKTLENLRDRFAVLEPCSAQKAEKGSFAILEVSFEVPAKPESNRPVQTVTVEVGEERLLPELEKAVADMSVGESRDVNATFPQEYDEKSLAGLAAVFHLKLLELKKKILPELNDAFAAQIKPGSTVLELQGEIRESIVKSKKEEVKRAHREAIVDYLIRNNNFEVPASMVDQQAGSLLQWMENDLQRRGMTVKNLKPEDLQSVRARAENMVRSSLLLREIATKEKISLDESKLQERVDALAGQMNRPTPEAKNFLEGKGMMDRLRDEVLTDQVFEFLLENAQWDAASGK